MACTRGIQRALRSHSWRIPFWPKRSSAEHQCRRPARRTESPLSVRISVRQTPPLKSFAAQPRTASARSAALPALPAELRQKDLFTKFVRSRDKIFYRKGIRLLRCHIACNQTKFPMLNLCAKDCWTPDHWISMVTIRLPFFKSNVFVHHSIKDTDRGNFPLPLFHQD